MSDMRPFVLLACVVALAVSSCGGGGKPAGFGVGDTYCQGGPKYGTSCYLASDVRQSPGGRPPLSSEPPGWWQPAPPGTLGSSSASVATATTGPGAVPMSSPAWRPQSAITDAGVAPTAHD